jgi:hypothetical protein
VNAVRQDPVERNLLYAATENGVYVSFDRGMRWQSLQNDLPRTSVRDVIVHGNDLIVATHGRGFWILDDVEPLRELARGSEQGLHLFAPEPAYRVRRSTNSDTPLPPEEPTGENPPDGAIVDYALAGPARRVTIAIYDRSGRLVRRYASDDVAPRPIAHLDKAAFWERPFVRPSATAGMHRFVWDLREPPPRSLAPDLPISAVPHDTPRIPEGPLVVPGGYVVKLEAEGTTLQRPLEVVMDPRVQISQQSLLEQYRLARRVASLIDRSYAGAEARVAPATAAAFAAINGAAGALLDVVDGADAPPTTQAASAVQILESRFDALAAPR